MNTNQDTTLTNLDSDKDMMGGIKVDDLEKMAKDGYPRPALSLAYGQGLIVGINRAKEKFKAATKASEQRIQELTASNNQLHEALERMVESYQYEASSENESLLNAFKVLESTTAQSLAEHDNEVIQMCANEFNVDSMTYKTIQSLKAKP